MVVMVVVVVMVVEISYIIKPEDIAMAEFIHELNFVQHIGFVFSSCIQFENVDFTALLVGYLSVSVGLVGG